MFASKARITLNPKKIYEAGGYAVKELLKIATMMYKAMQSSETAYEDEEMGITTNQMMDVNMSSKVSTLKAAK
jgi:clusterin-associated protein 1